MTAFREVVQCRYLTIVFLNSRWKEITTNLRDQYEREKGEKKTSMWSVVKTAYVRVSKNKLLRTNSIPKYLKIILMLPVLIEFVYLHWPCPVKLKENTFPFPFIHIGDCAPKAILQTRLKNVNLKDFPKLCGIKFVKKIKSFEIINKLFQYTIFVYFLYEKPWAINTTRTQIVLFYLCITQLYNYVRITKANQFK